MIDMAQQIEIISKGQGTNSRSVVAALVDDKINCLSAIEAEHHQVHQGFMFRFCNIFNNIAAGANAEVLIKTGSGSDEYHIKAEAIAGASAIFYLLDGATSTTDGTYIPVNNMNMISANTPNLRAFYAPTGAIGTAICAYYIAGGTVFKGVIGGDVRMPTEWILNKSSNYLLRASNTSANASTIEIAAEFYEV